MYLYNYYDVFRNSYLEVIFQFFYQGKMKYMQLEGREEDFEVEGSLGYKMIF